MTLLNLILLNKNAFNRKEEKLLFVPRALCRRSGRRVLNETVNSRKYYAKISRCEASLKMKRNCFFDVVKSRFFLTFAFCLSTIGYIANVSTIIADDSASSAVFVCKSVVLDVTKLCGQAKAEYSERYDGETARAKEVLLVRIREYSRYADVKSNSTTRTLTERLKLQNFLERFENKPVEFTAEMERWEKILSETIHNSDAKLEQEKRLNDAIGLYLATSRNDRATPKSEDELELAKAEQEYFNDNCDRLAQAVDAYFTNGEDSSFDEVIRALGEMKYYQPEAPAVAEISRLLQNLFSGCNFYCEASERFLSAVSRQKIEEKFDVQEYIRETYARGNGILKGETTVDLKKNPKQAELTIGLNANITTKTVGQSRGVYVYSDSVGTVNAVKPLFINANGFLTTSQSSAKGRMKTRVNNVNSERLMLFGGKIIMNKVNQELPYSEQESSARMNKRVAEELEAKANEQIDALNRRIDRMLSRGSDPMVRRLATSSSDDRIFCSCCLGRRAQLTAPNEKIEPVVRNFYKTHEKDAFSVSGRKRVAPRYSDSILMERTPYSSRRLATSYRAEFDSSPDVVVRMHQSGPNNAATVALASAVFGSGADSLDDVIARFPGVEPNDVKEFLTPYIPKEHRELDPEDSPSKEIYVQFDASRPFATSFDRNKIETTLRVASCVVDGKEWGPLEVRFIYRLEKKGASFLFVREDVDVLPEGYVEGDSVSARFHTFRRIFLKRLETQIEDEYVVKPISMDDPKTKEKRGALVPSYISAEDGWFTVEFKYDSNYGK